MSRRRAKDPTTAISITLPRSLLDQIDDKLTRTSSRSKWIADACTQRLGAYAAADLDTRVLLSMLHARLPPSTLAGLIQDKYNELTSSNLSEGP
jgi:metal-responsive CopG/Arc/MetJ family transcriptional regulator